MYLPILNLVCRSAEASDTKMESCASFKLRKYLSPTSSPRNNRLLKDNSGKIFELIK